MAGSNHVLSRNPGDTYAILPLAELTSKDFILPGRMEPCLLNVSGNGMFTFTLTNKKTNFRIYDREDPRRNEDALREALPELYRTFRP